MVRINRPSRWRAPFTVRLAVARWRARLIRRRRLLHALIVVVVVLAPVVVGVRVDDARARWGDVTTVVVASAAAPAGGPVGAAAPELAVVPADPLVDDALPSLPDSGSRLRLALRPGEVVTGRHLVSGDRGEVGPHERVLAIPLGPSTPPLRAGDDIELVLLAPTHSIAGEPPPSTVVARVVDPGDDAVLVAVRAEAIPAVAGVLTRGDVVIARR